MPEGSGISCACLMKGRARPGYPLFRLSSSEPSSVWRDGSVLASRCPSARMPLASLRNNLFFFLPALNAHFHLIKHPQQVESTRSLSYALSCTA